jgi:hypothetical protein
MGQPLFYHRVTSRYICYGSYSNYELSGRFGQQLVNKKKTISKVYPWYHNLPKHGNHRNYSKSNGYAGVLLSDLTPKLSLKLVPLGEPWPCRGRAWGMKIWGVVYLQSFKKQGITQPGFRFSPRTHESVLHASSFCHPDKHTWWLLLHSIIVHARFIHGDLRWSIFR